MLSYFAYGSNNRDQMIARMREKNQRTDIPQPRSATLTGYKLVFNKWSKKRKAYVANVVWTGEQNDKVHGIVFQLKQGQMKALHSYEGTDSDGNKLTMNGYKVVDNITVKLTDSNIEEKVFLYQSEATIDSQASLVDYINRNLKAYLNNGYPKEYIDNLLSQMVVNHNNHKPNSNDIDSQDRVAKIKYLDHQPLNIEKLTQRGYTQPEIAKLKATFKERNQLLEQYKNRFNLGTLPSSFSTISASSSSSSSAQSNSTFFCSSHQAQLKEKMEEGKQRGVLRMLACHETVFTADMLTLYNNQGYRSCNSLTISALKKMVQSLQDNENKPDYSFTPGSSAGQNKLLYCIKHGLQKGALVCLAKGAKITPQIYTAYIKKASEKTSTGLDKNPKLIEEIGPFIKEYKIFSKQPNSNRNLELTNSRCNTSF